MDYLTFITKLLGVEFDQKFIMQHSNGDEILCKIDKMGLWEYKTSSTECQIANNDLVRLLVGDYKIKKLMNKKEDSEKVLPIPCTKVEEETVKDWFSKINEELDELKEVIPALSQVGAKYLFKAALGGLDCKLWAHSEAIAEEAADTITAITSMLEAMGIDENMRQEAQRRVNEKNKERGRL